MRPGDRSQIHGPLLAAIGATVLLVGADMSESERALLVAVLHERAASVAVVSLLLLVPLVFILKALFRRYVAAPRRLAEDARIMQAANPAHRAIPSGSEEIRRLAETVNAFADAHASLRDDVARRVHEANARIEQERNRLAALMSELTQSVVVCNVEGRILLYNTRARQVLRKPMEGAAAGGKAPSLVGLGRSMHEISRFQDLLRWGAVDLLRPSLALNSVVKIRRMAAVAETHYVAVAPHHDGGPIATAAGIHLAASLPNSFIQQIPFPSSERDRAMRAELLSGNPETAKDGFAPLVNKPGFGIDVDEKALDRYSEEKV